MMQSSSGNTLFTASDNTKGKFPLYPSEGMEYLIEKLGSRIIVERVGRIYYITPNDESITVKEKEYVGKSRNYILLLNNVMIASSLNYPGQTALYLVEIAKQLEPERIAETIELDFFDDSNEDNEYDFNSYSALTKK